ncbi:substrate-binding periplasmic protein [Kiloniella sp.]|uniref:substrate-binding periplasmic protein n=1 Tax=Kiloniella sp. TaxID=1938587 RepID=UPI003B019FF1
MISLKLIVICSIFLAYFPCAAETIKLVQDPWPPITSEDIANEALATAIVTTAFSHAGYTPIVKTIPWKRALIEVETVKSDAIVAAYYNDDRSQIYNYSAPYLITPILFLKRKDSEISFQSLEDLRDYRIGFVRGTSYGNSFDQAEFLNKVELNDPSTVIKMLYNKRIDVAPFTNVVGMHLINSRFPDWRNELEYFGPPIEKLHYYVIVGKNHNKGYEILSKFNNAIAKMLDSGAIEKIIKDNGLQDAFPD